MSGYHFFVEIDGGQWHRTEGKGEPGGPPVECSCGISNQDPRVLKLRGHDDSSWKWVPPQAVGRCFPEAMTKPPGDRKPSDHGDGVPMCSHLVCPKYSSFSGKCGELDAEPDAVCVPAVRDIVLRLDCHEDASTPAFDEIAALCGVPQWEYPGQVIRDVQLVVRQRNELRELEKTRIELINLQQAAIAREREERDKDLHLVSRQGKVIGELQTERDSLRTELTVYQRVVEQERERLADRLRVAAAVRDDARAASQRYLDEKRAVEELRRNAEIANEHYAATLASQEKRIVKLDAERNQLAARGDELRKLIVKLTNETPFPGELDECRAARAALIAEVGTLRSQVTELAGKIKAVIGTEVQGYCLACGGTGVIETGNNDHPCDCAAGDDPMFNTTRGRETGAQIKARR